MFCFTCCKVEGGGAVTALLQLSHHCPWYQLVAATAPLGSCLRCSSIYTSSCWDNGNVRINTQESLGWGSQGDLLDLVCNLLAQEVRRFPWKGLNKRNYKALADHNKTTSRFVHNWRKSVEFFLEVQAWLAVCML